MYDCQHKGQKKRSAYSSAMRRRLLFTILTYAKSMGHGDGRTYADCVACGLPAIVGLGNSNPDAFNLGHVIPDSTDGHYCPCNLVPQCRACNERLGDVIATDAFALRYDTRPLWDGRFLWVGIDCEEIERVWIPPQ